MNQLLERADQCRAEIEKQSSARASQIESLLIVGDFDAIREWLDQWQLEDKVPGSLRDRYQEIRSELKKRALTVWTAPALTQSNDKKRTQSLRTNLNHDDI